jgi:hypothetical protein
MSEVKVAKQVMVLFSIGKYVDKVLCDVVPIRTSHYWRDHDNIT